MRAAKRRLMRRDRLGQLLDQNAQFADLRGDRLDRGAHAIHRACQLALGGGEAALDLGHLLGQIGVQPRQVGDLIADSLRSCRRAARVV